MNELLQIFSQNRFSTVYAKVILVGFRTEEIPICNFLFLPAEFYTYKYLIDGLTFYQNRVANSHFGELEHNEGGAIIHFTQIDDLINSII